MMSVRMPLELKVAIELRAEREGRNASNVIVGLVRAGLQVVQAIESERRPIPAVSSEDREPAATVRDEPSVTIAAASGRPGHDKATCTVYGCGMCKVS